MKKNGGFTLVELLVVVAILCILTVLAVQGFNSWKANPENRMTIHRPLSLEEQAKDAGNK